VSLNDAEWILARGSGMAATVLLTAVVALGLALSLRLASDRWPRVLTTAGHRQLTNLALVMTGLHLAMLLVDADAAMSLADLVIPFASGYRPVATALGVLAVYVLLITWVSTLMRARLGQRRWRALHRVAIVAWVLAMLHGVFAGSDTGTPWAVFTDVAAGLVVGMLLAARIAASRRRAAAHAAPEPAPAQAAHAAGGLPPLRGYSAASRSAEAARSASRHTGSNAVPASRSMIPRTVSRGIGPR
jgi:sulfoxide reductase heme-binding subunit YedZ